MMNIDRKKLLNLGEPTPPGSQLRLLIVGRAQSESVELQAALAPLHDIIVETVPTLARLSIALQKGGSPPDLVMVDVNPDNPDDISLLRDLRKITGIGDIPIVALTERATIHAPLRAMRAGADDVLLKPIDLEEARDVFTRVMEHPRLNRPGSSTVGKVVAFMHLSGGAGATTLAVNTACALARVPRTKPTCLLDFDIQFGNAASLLDLPSTSPIQEFIDDPTRLDVGMLESMMLRHQSGLQVLTAPRALLPLNAYASDGLRTMIDVAKQHFGFIVFDLPVALAPWTDSVLKTATVIYLVTSMSVPSAHRLIKFLDLLHEEGVRELPMKIVANRHHKSGNRGSDISVAQFEKATGRKVDFLIPNDYSLISMSHGQGKPAIRLKPNSPFTVALTEMLGADLGKDVFTKPKRSFFSFRRT